MDKIKYTLLILALMVVPAWGKTKLTRAEPSVLVYNITKNQIEYAKNKDQVRPIASITKIMTAMVALDHDKDLSKTLKLRGGVSTSLPKESYNRWQLLQAMLVRSDNAAAETLASDYPGGRSAFIARMNQQARDWNMINTRFEDPTGLSANNTSTAEDVSNMLDAASGYWIIQEVSTRKQIAVETQFKKRIRTVNLRNTNSPLLFEFDNIVVSKTGFTNPAGFCLGLVVEQQRQHYAIVVLGTPSKRDRIQTVEKIMYNHVLDNQFLELELTTTP
jgi:D-alanyl-D-alanine endopeptidase (penicillin-binding protein 7)